MSVAKITVAIDEDLLSNVDLLVQSNVFRSRSQAIQTAVPEKVERLGKTRLARTCALFDPYEERILAYEGLASEAADWPVY